MDAFELYYLLSAYVPILRPANRLLWGANDMPRLCHQNYSFQVVYYLLTAEYESQEEI